MDELLKRTRDAFAIRIGELANDKDGSKLATCRDLLNDLAAFAASEADRREREMLKAICSTLCEHCEHFADPPERDFVLIVAHDDVRWRHLYDDEDGRTVECEASIIREAYHEWTLARRLREQREKGKAGPLTAGTPS